MTMLHIIVWAVIAAVGAGILAGGLSTLIYVALDAGVTPCGIGG